MYVNEMHMFIKNDSKWSTNENTAVQFTQSLGKVSLL